MQCFEKHFKEEISIEYCVDSLLKNGPVATAKALLSKNLNNDNIEFIASCICKAAERVSKGKDMYANLAVKLSKKIGTLFANFLCYYAKNSFLRILYNYGVLTINDFRSYLKKGAREWIYFAIELNFSERSFGEFDEYFYRRKKIRRSGFVDFIDLIYYGYKRGTIEHIIKYDNIEELKKFNDFDSKIELNVLHFDCLNNTYKNCLDFAAFYGSDNCFNYMLAKGCKLTQTTLDCALIGRNQKIILKVMENISFTVNSFKIIAQYHLIDFYDKIPTDLYKEPSFFALCIESCNANLMMKCVQNGVDFRDQHFFVCAAGSNYMSAIKFFFSLGLPINQQDTSNVTPLSAAAKNECQRTLIYLLDKGASVAMGEGCAMEMAVKAGNDIIMAILLKHCPKMDINSICGESNTLLHWSALTGKIISAQFLISHGADIEAKDSMGYTPLIVSAFRDDIDTTLYLIQNGAKIEQKSYDDKTALIVAVEKSNEKIVKALLQQGANPNSKGPSNKTALFFCNSVSVFHLLIKHGADPKIMADNNTSILHSYAKERNDNIISLALEYVSIESKDSDGNTPFLCSCSSNNTNAMLYLISKGCNIHAKNKSERSAFHLFAENNKTDALIEFLKNHEYSDKVDKHGKTALHICAKKNYLRTAEILIQSGAKLDVKDHDNQIPYDLATSKSLKRILNPEKAPNQQIKKLKKISNQ